MKPTSKSQSENPSRLDDTLDQGEGGGAVPERKPFAMAAHRLLTDERLARLAAKGDRMAFEAIFDRYHQELYRYCVSLLRNREDAADALQSTMMRALRALDGDNRDISLRPWLYRIAHNESMTLLRQARPDRDRESAVTAVNDVEASASTRARLAALLSDIRDLPDRQRGALVMRELSGLGYEEIADALDTSPAGAKQAVYDARRALYAMAEGRDADCDVIRRTLSEGDGRRFRGRMVRAHLRSCDGCRSFKEQIDARESKLASFTPALPAAAAWQTLHGAFAGAGLSGSTGAGFLAGVGTAATAPAAAVAVAVVLGAGAVGVGELARPSGDGPGAGSRVAPAPLAVSDPRFIAHRRSDPHDAAERRRARAAAQREARRERAQRRAGREGKSRDPDAGGEIGEAGDGSAQTSGPGGPSPSNGRGGGGFFSHGRSEGERPIREGIADAGGTVVETVGQIRDALPVETPDLPRRAAILHGVRD
jgi:RNA polymerase sigma factor (sigma-70 family)